MDVASRPSRHEWVSAACILILAAVLRLYGLGAENFWIDELFQIRDASQPIGQFMGGYVDFDPSRTHKSPVSLLIHHVILQATESEAALRLPSALASIAEVGVLFILARILFGFPIAALTALFLAVNPLHVWYAQEARWYALWSLLSTSSFLLLLWARRRRTWAAWAGYAASLAAAAYTFVLTFVIMAVQGLTTVLQGVRSTRAGVRIKHFAIAGAAAACVAAPVLWMIANRIDSSAGTPRPTRLAALPYAFFAYVGGYSVGPTVRELHSLPPVTEILATYPIILIFLAVFTIIGILALRETFQRRGAPELLLPWAVGIPLLVFAMSLASGIEFNVRYTLPALPAVAIFLALGIAGVPPRWRAVAAASVLGCLGWGLANYHFDVRYDKEDVRGAMNRVARSTAQGGPVIVVGQVAPAAVHYGRGLRLLYFRECEPAAHGRLAGSRHEPGIPGFRPDTVARDALQQRPTIWLLAGRDWEDDAADCMAWLRQSHRVRQRHEFTGVELLHLERRLPAATSARLP